MFEVIRRIGDGTAATVHRNYLRRAAELLRQPTVRWRPGGAQRSPEIPDVSRSDLTEIVAVWTETYDDAEPERFAQIRGLRAAWKPGGEWWKQCESWCYVSELIETAPIF